VANNKVNDWEEVPVDDWQEMPTNDVPFYTLRPEMLGAGFMAGLGKIDEYSGAPLRKFFTEMATGKELEKAFNTTAGDQVMKTHTTHMDIERNGSSRMVADLTGITKADGNNVDIDLQMAALANNGSDFSNAVQLMKHKFGLYRASIRDGRS
jgi:hypothetical protein